MTTVSIAKGTGSMRHNDRTIKNKSQERTWDETKSHMNIVYKNDTLENVYHELFDNALEQYNQKILKTKNKHRIIKNYLEHISRSKQEKTSYEFIIQIGNIDDLSSNDYPNIQKALHDYNRSFQKRNPNFCVVQQITHRDEIGMEHTHIHFVPFSTNNKRGLSVKNSFGGALAEMGFGKNGFDKWRENELEYLQNIMHQYNLEFTIGDERKEHLNVKAYKEYVQFSQKANELKSQCETYNLKNVELKTEQIEIQNSIVELQNQRNKIYEMPTNIVISDEQFRQKINSVLNQNENLEHLKLKNKNDFENHLDENDSNVMIKKNVFGGEQMVQMPLSFWKNVVTNHNQLLADYYKVRSKFNSLIDELLRSVRNLFDTFKYIKKHPTYLDFKKINSKMGSLIKENDELKIKNNSLTTQLKEIESENEISKISDIMLCDMAQINVYDDDGFEVNMLEYAYEKGNLSDYAIDTLNKHIDKQMQKAEPVRKKSRGIDR